VLFFRNAMTSSYDAKQRAGGGGLPYSAPTHFGKRSLRLSCRTAESPEHAEQIAAHESAAPTKLHNRYGWPDPLDQVEKIGS
jgi:hypothetical protein